jgi:hypothetical protein
MPLSDVTCPLQVVDDVREVGSPVVGPGSLSIAPSLPSGTGQPSTTVAAQLHATLFCCCKRGLGPLRDHAALRGASQDHGRRAFIGLFQHVWICVSPPAIRGTASPSIRDTSAAQARSAALAGPPRGWTGDISF